VTAARMKLPVIVVTIIGAGLALLSWSQTWYELRLADAAAGGEAIAVPGSVASPALAALGLAGLALVAALAIAGPGIRIVLGVLEILLGGCVLLAAGVSLGDPVAAVAPAVTDATGVTELEDGQYIDHYKWGWIKYVMLDDAWDRSRNMLDVLWLRDYVKQHHPEKYREAENEKNSLPFLLRQGAP